MKKSEEQIKKRTLTVAEQMDKSCAGVKGIIVNELYAYLWVLGLDEKMSKIIPTPLKKGKRNTFYQDNVKKLYEVE